MRSSTSVFLSGSGAASNLRRSHLSSAKCIWLVWSCARYRDKTTFTQQFHTNIPIFTTLFWQPTAGNFRVGETGSVGGKKNLFKIACCVCATGNVILPGVGVGGIRTCHTLTFLLEPVDVTSIINFCSFFFKKSWLTNVLSQRKCRIKCIW